MKWDNTQSFLDQTFDLFLVVMTYCGNISVKKGKAWEQSMRFFPDKVSEDDAKKAYEIFKKMDIESVACEIEEKLTCDIEHDGKILFVWQNKMIDGCRMLCAFSDILLKSKVKADDNWSKLGLWEDHLLEIEDRIKFVWLIAVLLHEKYYALQCEVKSMMKNYCIETDTSFLTEAFFGLIMMQEETVKETKQVIIKPQNNTRVEWTCNKNGTCFTLAKNLTQRLPRFLIKEKIIPNDVPEEVFLDCVRYAQYDQLLEGARAMGQITRFKHTINFIAHEYFNNGKDYILTSIDSMNLTCKKESKKRYLLGKGDIDHEFLNRLKTAIR